MTKQFRLISICIVVLVMAVIIAFIVKKYSPSKDIMSLDEYYNVSSDEMAVILQDTLSDEKGYYIDQTPYVSYQMVKENFNKRFYWDKSASTLVYTTPTEIIKAGVGSKQYSVNKSSSEIEAEIVKIINDVPYVAVPFIKLYSNIEYVAYERPNRIVFTFKWGENRLMTSVKKDTVIRYEDNIKSPVLASVSANDSLTVIGSDEEINKGFSKVITIDGVIGYIQNKRINESVYEKLESSYAEPQYSHITKDHDICMVWHMVTSQDANSGMLNLINKTKGVNTISPTWFSVSDNEGNVSSLANENYVKRAHEGSIEVWGLCNDQTEGVDINTVLSNMSSREKLENKLVSLAIEYELDGLNIDFEHFSAETGPDFIQFIREISTKCRNNGIVLSIDDYIPVSYRDYYDYEEQGIVADYVVIMAYDEHYAGSEEAGSVSSIGFVKDASSAIAAKVDTSRVIMGLPFYTRLWEVSDNGNGPVTGSETYGMTGAVEMLNKRNITPSWDVDCGQYYAEYAENGSVFKIWVEEETSITEKINAIKENGINNAAFWRLGFDSEQVWDVVANNFNSN